jgi:RsiW-degrading membrane proteinase PrsW (M82 family)
MNYAIIIYIVLGVSPSLVWLAYYLREDAHPEPKRTVLKIFLWGFVMVLPVFFIQTGFISLLAEVNMNPTTYALIYFFPVVALSEEFFKYLVIREKIINSPDLDEPPDIMLYMVIAALGFAALENILYFPILKDGVWMPISSGQVISWTLFIRFISTTLLHSLCSAVVGYSLAISFYEDLKGKPRRYLILAAGILIAALSHGLYDFCVMTLSGFIKYAIPAFIIVALAFFVFAGFVKLKKMKSICKI